MLNINELENRHKKYKLKSYIPYIISIFSVIIIFSTILLQTKIFNSIPNSEPKHEKQIIKYMF